ncbi:MAG: S8/S53 family peptidase [Pseudoclavibacter sp.]
MCAVLVAVGLALAGTASGALATPAHADDGDGLWYVNLPGVQQAHTAGITGKGIKIADIDTPINPDAPFLKSVSNIVVPHRSYCQDATTGKWVPSTSTDPDEANHATEMVGLLKGNGQGAVTGQAPVGLVPDATVYVYPVGLLDGLSRCTQTSGDPVANALRSAISQKVDVIVMPMGGFANTDVVSAVLDVERAGIPVFISRDNDDFSISKEDPAGVSGTGYISSIPGAEKDLKDTGDLTYLPGLVTVQAVGYDGALQSSSAVIDRGVDIVSPGVGVTRADPQPVYDEATANSAWGTFTSSGSGGTSSAAVISAGYYALAKQKWPHATTNQLLQLMARTTPANVAKLSPDRDAQKYLGWGFVSVKNMLATDPAKFPDVNPALQSDVTSQPSLYQSGAGKKFADLLRAQESAKASPSAAAKKTPVGGVLPVWAIGGGALVVLCGIGVLLLVLLRRRRRGPAPRADEALSGSARPQLSSSWPQPGAFPRDPGPIPPRPPRPSEKS